MLAWLWFLIAVLVLGPIVSGAVLYVVFGRSREKQWRDHVLALRDAARYRALLERGKLRDLAREQDEEARQLRAQAFGSALRRVPVEDLDPYPGIGPDTIAKLREGGFPDLAALQNAQIHIHGLGPKRLSDIDHAVRDLLNRARARFNRGDDSEAKRLAGCLGDLAGKYEQRAFCAQARIRAAETVADALEPYAVVARRVTFRRYFRPPPEGVVPEACLKATLPDLEQTVRASERKAEAAFSETTRLPEALPVRPALEAATAGPARVPSAKAPLRPAAKAPAPGRVRDPWAPEPAAAPLRSPKKVAAAAAAVAVEQEDKHVAIMELTIQFALAAARADGPVTDSERALIEAQLQRRFGYNAALSNKAKGFAAHYETAPIDLDRCVARIKQRFAPAHRNALVAFGREIVAARGGSNQRGLSFLESVARRLDVPIPSAAAPAAVFSSAKNTVPAPASTAAPAPKPRPEPPPSADPRSVLEIDPALPLTPDLIRRQFRLLTERYAPEKFATVGAEFVAIAEGKRSAVRAAAAALLAPLGEPLEPPAAPAAPAELRHNPDLDAMFGA